VKLAAGRSFWHDVAAVMQRYDTEREGLGDEFLDAIDAALALIAERPDAWAVWPGIRPESPPLRRYVMARFPYAIGYQVLDGLVAVTVLAHAKRRPGFWQ
jgi:toxin ParE1/3/4